MCAVCEHSFAVHLTARDPYGIPASCLIWCVTAFAPYVRNHRKCRTLLEKHATTREHWGFRAPFRNYLESLPCAVLAHDLL